MEFALILLAIFWVVIPLAAKNSQKKAKAEEERRRAMRQQAPQSQRAQQPVRTAPLTPSILAAQPSVYASMEGAGSQEGTGGPIFEGVKRQEKVPSLTSAKSSLTDAMTSITHTVTVSSESGHAHEETSASGIVAECPPDKASKKQNDVIAPRSDESSFVWDVEATRSGLVMAEILGPCLALRD